MRTIFKEAILARQAKIEYYNSINPFQSPTEGVDSGAFGKMRELENARELSLKKRVSGIGIADLYFHVDGKPTRVEYKTNGGRIGSILKSLANGHDGFVAYEMHIQNSNTGNELREVLPVVMKASTFIAMLEKAGAIRQNSRDGEPCIQSTLKAWYNILLDYPLPFDSSLEYLSSDFEDIEI